jgi:hypothetical protein
MTNQSHPITPPPEPSDEQVGNWLSDDDYPWEPSEPAVITITPSRLKNVARQAFQAGADQELEACCEWLSGCGCESYGRELRAARRPKPPSLKEQALAALDEMQIAPCVINGIDTNAVVREKYDAIRHALQLLPDNTTY